MTGTENRLEPDTVGDTDVDHCVHSIAISLKRIADELCGDEKRMSLINSLYEITRHD